MENISTKANFVLFGRRGTGNIIGSMTRSSGNILGGILLFLGIVGVFFTIKK